MSFYAFMFKSIVYLLYTKTNTMAKYSIHSTKQDWENLYNRIDKINKISHNFNLTIKEAKKSQSMDLMDWKVTTIEQKLGLAKPFQYGTTTTSWKNGKKTVTFKSN